MLIHAPKEHIQLGFEECTIMVHPSAYRGIDLACDILHGTRTHASQTPTATGFPHGFRRLLAHRRIEPEKNPAPH